MSDSEQFDRAIEKLLADQSPRSDLFGLDEQEERMVRTAQLLRGSQTQGPRPEFVERLHDRLFPQPRKISRRTAFLSGFGALAAGILAGIGLDRSTRGGASKKEEAQPLVTGNGRWVAVAQVADVPPGAIHAFNTGAIQGFIMNRNGTLHALSRICTHMGCRLNFQPSDQGFVCPCHGATFDLRGHVRLGPKGYGEPLPSLPRVHVRVNGQAVEVWTA